MIEFHLPIRGTEHWYRVTIFPTRKAMYAAYREAIENGVIEESQQRYNGKWDFLAQCSWRRKMPDGSSGWIIFCKKAIGAGVVSHEMTHAAIYHVMYRERRWRFWIKKQDERLAYIQGDLVRDFWNNWYAFKP